MSDITSTLHAFGVRFGLWNEEAGRTPIKQWHTPIENPAGPTPTRIEWRLEDRWLVGIERPVKLEHYDRAAGKMLLDAGEWREIRYVGIELPDEVEKALTLNFGDETLGGKLRSLEEEGIRDRERIIELEQLVEALRRDLPRQGIYE